MFRNLTATQKEKVNFLVIHSHNALLLWLYVEMCFIRSVFNHSFLLLSNQIYFSTSLFQVYRVMTLRHVVMDEVIIREGDKGDEMYIVER